MFVDFDDEERIIIYNGSKRSSDDIVLMPIVSAPSSDDESSHITSKHSIMTDDISSLSSDDNDDSEMDIDNDDPTSEMDISQVRSFSHSSTIYMETNNDLPLLSVFPIDREVNNNCYISPFNAAIALSTNAHSNVQHLTREATGERSYIADYMTKAGGDRLESLPLIEEAVRISEQRGSNAPDFLINEHRMALRTLNRAVNNQTKI